MFYWHFSGFTGIDDRYEPPLNSEVSDSVENHACQHGLEIAQT